MKNIICFYDFHEIGIKDDVLVLSLLSLNKVTAKEKW